MAGSVKWRMTAVMRSSASPAKHADVAPGVDRIGTDDQLVRFAVDHPPGVRADDAFRPAADAHVGRHLKQPHAGAAFVGHIADVPQPFCPRDHGPDAAFAVGVGRSGQVRIDTAELDRLSGRSDADK